QPTDYRAGYSGYADNDQDYYDDNYDRPRRNWVFIAAVIGALVVTVSVCAVTVYLLTSGDETPDPNADLTLTVNSSSSDIPALPQMTLNQNYADDLIAFDSRRNGNYDIFIMNVDGTGLRILTSTSGAERGPTWSPDRTQIAFYGASSETGKYDIYVINVDGTGLTNFTNSPTIDDKYPTWSPDGSQLAYHSDADGDYDLYVIETNLNAPNFGAVAITNNNVDDLGPDWSPEGTQIAFHTALWGDPYEIAILDLNTGQIRQITNSANTSAFPTWSPNGTRIAYHVIGDQDNVTIYITRPDGSPAQALTTGSSYSAFPDWSPDGSLIIYQSGQNTASAIYMIPVNGGTPQSLTGTQANYLPEWSPR
ncbi:MAG: PD40 domain-containing protein, partial [Anaerolineae bacterium]|nr:PD40 domain-containing protein [Anaerolineae bacterium]